MVEKFLVSGASKRGWTAWLVGGVDDRVVAIAPIVMDMLNFQPVGGRAVCRALATLTMMRAACTECLAHVQGVWRLDVCVRGA